MRIALRMREKQRIMKSKSKQRKFGQRIGREGEKRAKEIKATTIQIVCRI